MSEQATKPCPRCRRAAHRENDRHGHEHTAVHYGAHQIRHHPLIAVVLLAGAGISKLLPHTYCCTGCGHTFRA